MHTLYQIGFLLNGAGVLILAVGVMVAETTEVTDTFDRLLGWMTSIRERYLKGWRNRVARWCVDGRGGTWSVILIVIGLVLQGFETFAH